MGLFECVGESVDVFFGKEHTCFDGRDGIAGEEQANLIGKEIRGKSFDSADGLGCFRNGAGECGESKNLEGGEGLEVGLESCAC